MTRRNTLCQPDCRRPTFHTADAAQQDEPRQLEALGPAAAATFGPETDLFGDDEAAARFYLAQEMGLDARRRCRRLWGRGAGAMGAPAWCLTSTSLRHATSR